MKIADIVSALHTAGYTQASDRWPAKQLVAHLVYVEAGELPDERFVVIELDPPNNSRHDLSVFFVLDTDRLNTPDLVYATHFTEHAADDHADELNDQARAEEKV